MKTLLYLMIKQMRQSKISDLFQRLSHKSNLLYQLLADNFQKNESKAQELQDFLLH